MTNRNKLHVVGFGTILLIGVSIAIISNPRFQKWYRPPVADLPIFDDVFEMRASLLSSHVGFHYISAFVVHNEYISGILRWLQPGVYEPNPPIFPDDELGEVWIKTKQGRDIHLRFYWTGHNPPVYTIDGKDYFWGNIEYEQGPAVDGGIRLGKAIRSAAEDSKHK